MTSKPESTCPRILLSSTTQPLGPRAGDAFSCRANCRGVANTVTYLAYNLVFRREMFRKQGLQLGLR